MQLTDGCENVCCKRLFLAKNLNYKYIEINYTKTYEDCVLQKSTSVVEK